MVKWTDHARMQLRHIHDYIAQDSIFYAKRVVEDLIGKTLTLDQTPYMGRRVPELANETVRELSLFSYRILYEIKLAHIEVLAVIHKRRDFKPDDLAEVNL